MATHPELSKPAAAGKGEATLGDIIEHLKVHRPGADLNLIRRAYVYAEQAHRDQRRKNGDPYIGHPVAVARILCELLLDEEAICAALLHDTVEDTDATLDELTDVFSRPIAELVDGVTKLSKIRFRSKEERQAENFRKMLLAMSKDIRVILVKLADRTHNMRTLQHLPPEKAAGIARETMDIFAPLANRLGLGRLKVELEDLSFRYTDPVAYKQIAEQVNARLEERQEYIGNVVNELQELMDSDGLTVEISGRPKHFTSIHRKMMANDISFELVHDLIAFRILVDKQQDCYHALGMIHDHWRPVPGRFKDYVALPKANQYQSLHTTVIGPDGHAIEVQIRTHDMHRIAEGGVAAHWRYKSRDQDIDPRDEAHFEWLKRMMEWQKELDDPSEFLESVKMELFAEDVYTFSPKGDLKVLIRGSTPVDFAYSIHSEVGNTCSGAMVNGHIVQLSYQLRNGDVVEILTNRSQRPSKSWLRFVKTNRAISRIRAYIKKEQRERSLELGEQMLDQELRRYSKSLARIRKLPVYDETARVMNLDGGDELLVQIGNGKLAASTVAKALLPSEESKDPKPVEAPPQSTIARFFRRVTGGPSGIVVDGLEGVKHSVAKCCSPVPGEPIVGFVTSGHVVSVHRKSCPQVLEIPPEREVVVTWGTGNQGYPVTLRVTTDGGTPGLLNKMTQAFADMKVNIDAASSEDRGEGSAHSMFTFRVQNLDHLKDLSRRLSGIRGVRSVDRMRNAD